jgi:hypothetical protein
VHQKPFFPNARVELIFIFLESNPDFKIENLNNYLTIIYGVIHLFSFTFDLISLYMVHDKFIFKTNLIWLVGSGRYGEKTIRGVTKKY